MPMAKTRLSSDTVRPTLATTSCSGDTQTNGNCSDKAELFFEDYAMT
jgi:hypothetical protein